MRREEGGGGRGGGGEDDEDEDLFLRTSQPNPQVRELEKGRGVEGEGDK